MKTVTEMCELFFKADIKGMVEKLRIPKKDKYKIQNIVTFVYKKKPMEDLKRAITQHEYSKQYMMKIRSSFYCSICDFKNQYYIDPQLERVQINLSSCADIASNTINYGYLMHTKVVPSIVLMGRIMNKIAPEIDPIVLRHFRKLRTSTIRCAKAFSAGGNIGNPCKKYCNFFNLNATSPVMEGFQEFFNDVMNTFSKFYKIVGIDQQINHRVLASIEYRREKLNERKLENLGKVMSIDDLITLGNHDDYKFVQTNPNMSKSVLSKMINF